MGSCEFHINAAFDKFSLLEVHKLDTLNITEMVSLDTTLSLI